MQKVAHPDYAPLLQQHADWLRQSVWKELLMDGLHKTLVSAGGKKRAGAGAQRVRVKPGAGGGAPGNAKMER